MDHTSKLTDAKLSDSNIALPPTPAQPEDLVIMERLLELFYEYQYTRSRLHRAKQFVNSKQALAAPEAHPTQLDCNDVALILEQIGTMEQLCHRLRDRINILHGKFILAGSEST